MKVLSIPSVSRRHQDRQPEIQTERRQPPSLSTRRLRWRAIALLACAVVASGPLAAFAAEAATIVNRSHQPVAMIAKWSNLPFESPLIVLAPGESWSNSGPDGAQLDIRFNSASPQLPFREMRYRVVTSPTFIPGQPGSVSSFRNVSPFLVDLFVF